MSKPRGVLKFLFDEYIFPPDRRDDREPNRTRQLEQLTLIYKIFYKLFIIFYVYSISFWLNRWDSVISFSFSIIALKFREPVCVKIFFTLLYYREKRRRSIINISRMFSDKIHKIGTMRSDASLHLDFCVFPIDWTFALPLGFDPLGTHLSYVSIYDRVREIEDWKIV